MMFPSRPFTIPPVLREMTAVGWQRVLPGLKIPFPKPSAWRSSPTRQWYHRSDHPVAADQSADIPLTIGQNGVQDVVLVVTGTTRFTRELAPYQFSIH